MIVNATRRLGEPGTWVTPCPDPYLHEPDVPPVVRIDIDVDRLERAMATADTEPLAGNHAYAEAVAKAYSEEVTIARSLTLTANDWTLFLDMLNDRMEEAAARGVGPDDASSVYRMDLYRRVLALRFAAMKRNGEGR
jgi:hypothetical protein